jgi:hypothetical protein
MTGSEPIISLMSVRSLAVVALFSELPEWS